MLAGTLQKTCDEVVLRLIAVHKPERGGAGDETVGGGVHGGYGKLALGGARGSGAMMLLAARGRGTRCGWFRVHSVPCNASATRDVCREMRTA